MHITAPELTLTAPKRYTVDGGSTPRQMLLKAHTSWKVVLRLFDDVRLDSKEGSFYDALEDYGSFKAKLNFDRGATKKGVAFLGTPFYDKAGKSKRDALTPGWLAGGGRGGSR